MSVSWREEPVTVSEATARANLRQWQSVLAADEWQRAWEALAEPEDERAAAAEPKLCKCDGCGAACDLNDDGTICDRDDEIFCGHCVAAGLLAEGEGKE